MATGLVVAPHPVQFSGEAASPVTLSLFAQTSKPNITLMTSEPPRRKPERGRIMSVLKTNTAVAFRTCRFSRGEIRNK